MATKKREPSNPMVESLALVKATALPLQLVMAKEYGDWLKKQSESLRAWLQAQEFAPKGKAEVGRYILLQNPNGKAQSLLLIVPEEMGLYTLALLPLKLPAALYRLPENLPDSLQEKLAYGWALGAYRFTRYKSQKAASLPVLGVKKPILAKLQGQIKALYRARDLINTPANDCGPEHLAAACKEVARAHKAEFKEIIGRALLPANYPLLHAVGRGSARPPRLLDLRWGEKNHPKVTLVGKGICFDSGGYDLKPAESMKLMKKDMGGAACALAVAEMLMSARLPVRLRLLIPAAENMVSGDAFRPLDVLPSRAGLSVEVGDTDAEGRLVLADALAAADAEQPDLLIDFATLTGAARVALGAELPALFCNSDVLADELQAAARRSEDPLWRLPLHAAHEEKLHSSVADINSCPGGGYAGAILAALFLQRFIKPTTPWAHLDLMAWNLSAQPGRPAGGEAMTARAVFSLIEARYAKKQAKRKASINGSGK